MFGFGHGMGYGTFFGGFGMIFILIFVIVIAIIGFKVLNTSNRNDGYGSISTQNENALDILKRRYAKGEIAQDEFNEMKKNL